jgi:hypothetical protein
MSWHTCDVRVNADFRPAQLHVHQSLSDVALISGTLNSLASPTSARKDHRHATAGPLLFQHLGNYNVGINARVWQPLHDTRVQWMNTRNFLYCALTAVEFNEWTRENFLCRVSTHAMQFKQKKSWFECFRPYTQKEPASCLRQMTCRVAERNSLTRSSGKN